MDDRVKIYPPKLAFFIFQIPISLACLVMAVKARDYRSQYLAAKQERDVLYRLYKDLERERETAYTSAWHAAYREKLSELAAKPIVWTECDTLDFHHEKFKGGIVIIAPNVQQMYICGGDIDLRNVSGHAYGYMFINLFNEKKP